MRNVLITGGSGFLGRQIVEVAKQKGYNTFTPRSVEFNIETMDGVDKYFAGIPQIDVIIHSAAYYGGIGINQTEPATIFHKNSSMAVNIFEIARKFNVKKILPIGSACSYPGHITGDLKEEYFWDGPLHDSVEAYGFSKKLQQVGQRAYFKQFKIESNHLVLTNLYGPYDTFTEYRSHVASALIKKFADAKIANSPTITLWGNGSPIREFLYVGDAAEAIVRAIELEHDISPMNIGTGIGTTIKELADYTKEFIGYEGEIIWDTTKPNGTARKVLDISKMKEKLHWQPVWNFHDGLKETIKWYLENKEEADRRL